VRIGVKPGQWGWTFEELGASWEKAEELGFDVVSCFDHVSARPAGLAAWDAPSLLVAMAARTRKVRLAVDVLNASLRHPFLLAGQLAVAQAASDGRLEVGLGAGSHGLARFDHGALGIPFPPLPDRLRRLETCCRLFPAMWRGETVNEASIGLHDASLGPLGIDPPRIVVGGRSDRVLEIAARHADGWNAVETDPAVYEALSRRLGDVCGRVGRDRDIMRNVQVFRRDIDLSNARSLVQRFEAAGAESVVFVLHEERGPREVERLAKAVL
jgi:alkanesulfonate monooxygenase SsuD/methylene tetrahydromethanopterin reductase-like flavin-dependent oxidoreductase (luciferase family)